jgi:Icc-related predicted phosphoesterase
MTILQLASDLHVDFHADKGVAIINELAANADKVDYLIIAGDLCSSQYKGRIPETLKRLCDKFKHVIFITGNHEYYGSSFGEVDNLIRDMDDPNLPTYIPNLITLQAGKVHKIGEYEIIGDTAWFQNTGAAKLFTNYLNDFFEIRNFAKLVYKREEACRKFLEAKVNKNSIVVTHHLPTPECISQRFKTSNINCYFLNDYSELIRNRSPLIWMFGHTHDSVDMKLHNTRLICNPLGYRGEHSNLTFNPSLLIEV